MNNTVSNEIAGSKSFGSGQGKLRMLYRLGALLFGLAALGLLIYSLTIRFEPITPEQLVIGEDEYPTVYRAISGTDADMHPTELELRADSYLGQYREFEHRPYCYRYWLQAQKLLGEDEQYEPDEAETLAAREEYEQFRLTTENDSRELKTKKRRLVYMFAAACVVLAYLSLAAITALITAVARRIAYIRQEKQISENTDIEDTEENGRVEDVGRIDS